MASDTSLSHEGKKRKKKSERLVKRRESDPEVVATVQEGAVDIEGLTASGHSALRRGLCEEALSCFKKAFKAAVQLKDSKVQRACAFNLGAAYVEAGKPQKGLDFLVCAQPGERGERVADLQFNLAVAHQALGQLGQAAAHYLQAAQLYRSQGDGVAEGDTCIKMARCHLQLQDWPEVAQSFQRAAESYKVAGRMDSAAGALKQAGSSMLQSEQFSMDDIIGVLTDCLELSEHVTDPKALGELYNDLGLSFSQLKLFPEAVSCYEGALASAQAQPARLAVVLQNLGAAHNSLNQYRQALDYHRQAAKLHGSLGSRRAQGRCFCNLGFALSQLGQDEEAAENYLHALQAFKDTEDYRGQWQACEGLGASHFQLKDLDKATVYYKQALSALAHCQDSSSSVQERLVNRLSEVLQHRLSVTMPGRQQRGRVPRRPVQDGTGPGPPGRTAELRGRKAGPGLQSQGLEFPQHPKGSTPNGPVTLAGGGVERGASGSDGDHAGRDPQKGSDKPQKESSNPRPPQSGPFIEQAEHPTGLLGANRNLNNTYEHPDPHYHNQAVSDLDYQSDPDQHGVTVQSE
ncbi:uncharacterized protein ttc24 [Aplochiton taeniatus]